MFNGIKGDFFEGFPPDIQDSGDPAFRALADLINAEKDMVIATGGPGVYTIENLADFKYCEKIPSSFLTWIGDMYDAGITTSDTERVMRQKICSAVSSHRSHGTVMYIRELITAVTGIVPGIQAFTTFNKGWDAINHIAPPSFNIDYLGGLFWDAKDTYAGLHPEGAFKWSIQPTGILIDVKNNGNYTAAQWQQILEIVADQKLAFIKAEVGYFDTTTGNKVVYKVVYSKNLAQTAWENLVDPGV